MSTKFVIRFKADGALSVAAEDESEAAEIAEEIIYALGSFGTGAEWVEVDYASIESMEEES